MIGEGGCVLGMTVFGTITLGTIAIFAVTHVYHFYLHIRLLDLPEVLTLLLAGPG